MGCNCRGKAGVKYEVKFADGTTQTYDTAGEALAAGNRHEGEFTFKAVSA